MCAQSVSVCHMFCFCHGRVPNPRVHVRFQFLRDATEVMAELPNVHLQEMSAVAGEMCGMQGGDLRFMFATFAASGGKDAKGPV